MLTSWSRQLNHLRCVTSQPAHTRQPHVSCLVHRQHGSVLFRWKWFNFRISVQPYLDRMRSLRLVVDF